MLQRRSPPFPCKGCYRLANGLKENNGHADWGNKGTVTDKARGNRGRGKGKHNKPGFGRKGMRTYVTELEA